MGAQSSCSRDHQRHQQEAGQAEPWARGSDRVLGAKRGARNREESDRGQPEGDRPLLPLVLVLLLVDYLLRDDVGVGYRANVVTYQIVDQHEHDVRVRGRGEAADRQGCQGRH